MKIEPRTYLPYGVIFVLVCFIVWYVWIRDTHVVSDNSKYLIHINDSITKVNRELTEERAGYYEEVDRLNRKVLTLEQQIRLNAQQHEKIIIRYRNATAAELQKFFTDRYGNR